MSAIASLRHSTRIPRAIPQTFPSCPRRGKRGPKIKIKSAPFSRFATACTRHIPVARPSGGIRRKHRQSCQCFSACGGSERWSFPCAAGEGARRAEGGAFDLPPPSPHRASQAPVGGKARLSERTDARVRAGPPAPRSAEHFRAAKVRCRGRRLFGYFRAPRAKVVNTFFAGEESDPLAEGEWKLWLLRAKAPERAQ